MRKIDRLFETLQILRGRRLRTAKFIADKLGVSVRTVYRDIQGLMASGMPIEGERGIGYIIRQPLELPPLHFTSLELRAIQFGIHFVQAVADFEVAAAAQEVAVKISDALPSHMKNNRDEPIAHIYFESDRNIQQILSTIRRAFDGKYKVLLAYTTGESRKISKRLVRPLGLEYWGEVWTLTAWCELREDFRVFRLDRIRSCLVTTEVFIHETGKTYQDYLGQFGTSREDQSIL